MREDEAQKISLARVGSVINGKWTIDRLIGVGGMASVYAATHRNTKRAALKIMHPELSAQSTIRERFLREGYLANMVDHPGVVSIDDDDITEDGCAYLVMELVEGETLEARLRRKGPLPPEEVLSFMDQVLHALATAHTRGVVHRDLKPENMLLAQNGEVKLLDFGIARARALSTDPTKTLTDGLMGTPAFMPPEQARGRWEEVDAQSDVWALGATMFTLLTGRNVHQAATTNEALAVAMMRHAPRLEEYRPELPASLLELVNKALEFEKKDRWPNATVMLLAVRRASSRLDDETLEAEAAAAAEAVHSDSQPELFFAENDASDTYIENVNEAELSDPDAGISGLSNPAPFEPPTNPLSSAPPELVERALGSGAPSARRAHTSDPPPKPPAPPRPSQRPSGFAAGPESATPAPASAPSPLSQPPRPPLASTAPAAPAARAPSQPAFVAAGGAHDEDPSLRIPTPVYQGPSSVPASSAGPASSAVLAPSAPENPFSTPAAAHAPAAAPALAAHAVTPNPALTHDSVLPARRVVPFSDVPVAGAVVTRPTDTTTARTAITAAVRAPSRQQWSMIGAGVLAFVLLLVVVLAGGDDDESTADAGAAATPEAAADPALATPPPASSTSPPKPATSPRTAKAKKKATKPATPSEKTVRASAPVSQAVDLEELPVEGAAAGSARSGGTTTQRRPAPKPAKTDANIFNQAKNLAVKRASQRSGSVKTGSGD